MALPQLTELDPVLAIRIIRHLRDGKTPPGGVEFLDIDRGWTARMAKELKKSARAQLTDVRVVTGSYAAGKSHALAATTTIALAQDWGVARLNVSADLGGQLDALALYRKTVQTLLVKERVQSSEESDRASYVAPASRSDGLRWALEHYATSQLEKHGAEALPARAADRELVTRFRVAGLDPITERAVGTYLRAAWEGRSEVTDSVWDYLCGLEKTLTKPVRLPRLDAGHGLTLLISLAKLLVHVMGYQGLLLTLDEAESIRKQKRRTGSWEFLRTFVDQDGAVGLFALVAMASEGVQDPSKGLMENEALRTRFATAQRAAFDKSKPFNAGSTILNLEKLTFSKAELMEMAKKVLAVWKVAEEDPSVTLPLKQLKRLVQEVMESCQGRPALYARALMQAEVLVLQELSIDEDRPELITEKVHEAVDQALAR
jgi:BREX system ATP-binding protein BrxC/D